MGLEKESALFDEESMLRQRYADVDEQCQQLYRAVDNSPLTASEFHEMFDISWIFHENGLEGVVLTFPEIKSAVDNKIISDISLMPTYKHIKDQKWCIDEIRERSANKRGVITVNLLKELHGRLIDKEELAGTYRKDIPIHRTYFHEIAQPDTIHNRLEEVMLYLKARPEKDMHPIEFAARVHHRYMRCFPFSKFSGLTGRLLLNFVLQRAGLLPVVIHATDRQRYYEALRNSELGFRKFLLECMENSLENAMRFFQTDTSRSASTGRSAARARA